MSCELPTNNMQQKEICLTNKIYKATQNYSPKQDTEMSLMKGDILTEVQLVDECWAAGRNFRGFVGVFPFNCVQEVIAVQNYRLPVDALLNEIGQMNCRKGLCDVKLQEVEPQPDCINQATFAGMKVGDEKQSDGEDNDEDDDQIKIEPVLATMKKTKKSFFSKPKMLVKPRTNKIKRCSLTGRKESPSTLKKALCKDTRFSSTFPFKDSHKDQMSYVKNRLIEMDPYYSQPSSQCNNYCTCGYSNSGQTVRKHLHHGAVRRASSVDIYENTRIHQNDAFHTNANSHNNSNNNSTNSSAMLYAKINTPSKRQFHILNRSVTPQHSFAVGPTLESHPVTCLQNPAYSNVSQLTLARFVGSCFTVFIIASLSLLFIIFLAKVPFLYCIIIIFSLILIFFFILLFSRLFRCLMALLLPSLSTNSGHVCKCFILCLLLFWGPITDIEHNITSSVGSHACLLEQVNNQTSMLMKPYDAVMNQVNNTLRNIQESAHKVDQALYPLKDSLGQVEMKLHNGHSQLMGTEQTCLNQFSRAHSACKAGLDRARGQCRDVMREIGSVHREAKEALDRINPNQWGAKSPVKRQVGSQESAFTRRNHDICEPLNEKTACRSFEENRKSCETSHWAGYAIQETINATQISLQQLYRHFKFHTSSVPYTKARERSEHATKTFKRTVLQQQRKRHIFFLQVVLLSQRLSVLLIIIPIFSAYYYICNYVTDVTFDSHYNEERFKCIDQFKSQIYLAPKLLPLRKHEKSYIHRETFSLKKVYKSRGAGFTILIATSLLFFWLYFVDFRMQQMLQNIVNEQLDTGDLNGWKSLTGVVSGEGMFVDIIKTFLSNMHPSGQYFGQVTNHTACLSPQIHFSCTFFVINVSVLVTFLMIVLLKPQLLHSRSCIAGYFYEESQRARVVWLHEHLSHRRKLYPRVLYAMVREIAKKKYLRKNISSLHDCMNRTAKKCGRRKRCLLCRSRGSNFATQRCEMTECFGFYCSSCFSDLNQLCPICHVTTTSSIV